jgi:hypothetical protein
MVFVFVILSLGALFFAAWVVKELWAMYDCNCNTKSMMYLPAHETKPEPVKFELNVDGKTIDGGKYLNWCRCLSVTKANHLITLMDDQWYCIHVKWANKPDAAGILTTVMSGLITKPEFLENLPCNIWCRFKGGPPDNETLYEASLLNYVVDRVFRKLFVYGEAYVDAMIIEALNFREKLLLEAPK